MHFIGVKLLIKNGKVKRFYNEEVAKALKEGWVEAVGGNETPKEKTKKEKSPENDLATKSYAELKEIARSLGIKNVNIKREALIKAIQEA